MMGLGLRTTISLAAFGLVAAGLGCSDSATGRAPIRCHTADLSAGLGFIQGAAGSRFGPVVLTNRSHRVCTLYGYIGGQLYGAAARRIPTRLIRDRTRPKLVVRLLHGQRAFADLHWSAIPLDGARRCPKPRSFAVTPPNARTQLRLRWTAGWVCGRGRIDVRPVRE
jgi:hypothetical protein